MSSTIEGRLEDITFDETIDSSTLSLDEITFDDTDSTIEGRLEDININDIDNIDDDSSINSLIDSIEADTTGKQELNLDDLGFETQSTDVSGLMSDQTTEIGNMSSNKTSDMNNISEWLDGLETPNKNTENISEWLDNLSTDRNDATRQNINPDDMFDSESESGDISFQFLEDLLERDTNKDD